MLVHEFVQQQLWKDREAEWNRRAKRGDFVTDAKPSAKLTVPAKGKAADAKSWLQKIGLV
ncbi:hypothetical protein [Paenibacillus soyae]|uniref:Uncharacterized protein n=1 Tax=Paenibacillus soyae TaxID=2969249 RepID=A0A9X2MSS8_9BACL|nr:hypothetical protein [Paenibacillus soyae]MCR2805559.1 hypothetical protein [Paenibacillus soyae]